MPPPHFTTVEILEDLAFLVIAIVVVVAYVGRPDRHRKATVLSDGRLRFSPNRPGIIASFVIEYWIVWLTVHQWVHAHSTMDFLFATGFAVGVIAFLTSIPGAVLVESEGLEQVFWFGRNKRIRWNEIVEINTGDKSLMITIKNGNGTAIVHLSRLPDRARLLWEIQQHCEDELPPEFPGEPMSGPD